MFCVNAGNARDLPRLDRRAARACLTRRSSTAARSSACSRCRDRRPTAVAARAAPDAARALPRFACAEDARRRRAGAGGAHGLHRRGRLRASSPPDERRRRCGRRCSRWEATTARRADRPRRARHPAPRGRAAALRARARRATSRRSRRASAGPSSSTRATSSAREALREQRRRGLRARARRPRAREPGIARAELPGARRRREGRRRHQRHQIATLGTAIALAIARERIARRSLVRRDPRTRGRGGACAATVLPASPGRGSSGRREDRTNHGASRGPQVHPRARVGLRRRHARDDRHHRPCAGAARRRRVRRAAGGRRPGREGRRLRRGRVDQGGLGRLRADLAARSPR